MDSGEERVITEEGAPGDVSRTLSLLEGDTEELKELIRVAMRYLHEHLDAIGNSIVEQNATELGKAAHKIKGSF